MTREEMLELRTQIITLYDERTALGDFDANAKTILVMLRAIIEIINQLLADIKKSK